VLVFEIVFCSNFRVSISDRWLLIPQDIPFHLNNPTTLN
jgi:hypothetical protein